MKTKKYQQKKEKESKREEKMSEDPDCQLG